MQKTRKHPKNKTVHMKCAVPKKTSILRILNILQSSSITVPSSSVPSPGRSVTQARRLYVSSLANFRVSDPKYGAEHRSLLAILGYRDTRPSLASGRAKPTTEPRSLPAILGSSDTRPSMVVGWRICREPRSHLGAYTVSLLCVVSTERCVTQVPHTSRPITRFKLFVALSLSLGTSIVSSCRSFITICPSTMVSRTSEEDA